MATIQNTLLLRDNMTPVLRNVIGAMDNTLSAMRRVKGFKMSDAFREASVSIEQARMSLDRFENQLNDIPPAVNKVSASFGALDVLKGMIGFQIADQLMELPSVVTRTGDALTGINARLALMNDGTMTQAELLESVYNAAQRSRSEFQATASSVAKLGLLASDAFSNTQEIVTFAELMNKAFLVSGASFEERTAGMYQLTQAMAAGKLQGDEFRSITENAPLLAKAIANFTGKTKGDLKEMSAEGTITAEIIKQSLFSASDEINSQMSTIPLQFEQAWTLTLNRIQFQFRDEFETISATAAGALMFINEHAYEIAIGIGYIGTVMTVAVLPTIWAAASASAVWAFNMALIHAPILAGVAALFMFVDLILKVPAILGNIIGLIYAGKTAIVDAFIAPLNTVLFIANGILTTLNKISGANYELFKMVEMEDTKKSFDKGYKIGVDFAVGLGKDVENLKNKFGNLGEAITNPFGTGELGAGGVVPVNVKGGKLDKVKITEEDFKYLRDVAMDRYRTEYSQTNIQPVINVNIDTVRETADVNQVLTAIEERIVDIQNRSLAVE